LSTRTISWRNFNLARVLVYIALTPVALYFGWLKSVTFVSLLSIWALVESAAATWRSDVPTEGEE
jgi:hypothetical protein